MISSIRMKIMTAQELVDELQLNGSITGNRLLSLSQEKIDILLTHFDPKNDALIHVDDQHFSINFGNVGTRGIQYSF